MPKKGWIEQERGLNRDGGEFRGEIGRSKNLSRPGEGFNQDRSPKFADREEVGHGLPC